MFDTLRISDNLQLTPLKIAHRNGKLKNGMYILGINAYHGDAAAALIKDGELIAAAEEERFNRVKHCAGFPKESISYCLEAAGITIEDVEHVGISRDPSAHLHKKVLFAATRAAKNLSTFSRHKAPAGEKPMTSSPSRVHRRTGSTSAEFWFRNSGSSAWVWG